MVLCDNMSNSFSNNEIEMRMILHNSNSRYYTNTMNLSLSAYFFLFSSPAVKTSSCTPESSLTSVTTSQRGNVLSGFAVTCLEITSKMNDSVVLNGLVYVANNGARATAGIPECDRIRIVQRSRRG